MMGAISRIYSQIFKNYKLMRNPWRAFDVTVWPLVLFFSITLFAAFMGAKSEVLSAVVLGLIGWRCVYHLSMDLVTSYMDEYWDDSLAMLMASPIRRTEFALGGIITGGTKFLIVLGLFSLLSVLMFNFQVNDLPIIILAMSGIILFGMAIGLISIGLIYIAGRTAFPIAFGLPDVICILTGVYYPVTVFPESLRAIAYLLPSTYAFEALRSTLGMAAFKPVEMTITLTAFVLLALLFNKLAFDYARKKGTLAKLG